MSAIQDAMDLAIADRIMPSRDQEIKTAVATNIKSDAQLNVLDRKADLTLKIVQLLRDEQGQDRPNADAIEAYQARLEELKKIS